MFSHRTLLAWCALFAAFAAISFAVSVGVGSVGEVSTEGTLGGDVSVVVVQKEAPGLMLERVLEAVPGEVQVFLVEFTPQTSAELNSLLARLEEEYENLVVVRGAPPYSNIGGLRRHLFEQGLVKTKYFLSVENIAYFDTGFLEELYDKAEALRAEEARHGRPTTVSFVPAVVEECDRASRGMWGRSVSRAHVQFWPHLFKSQDTGRLYFQDNVMMETSTIELEDDQAEERWKDALRQQSNEKFGETGVADTAYINFVEDHVFLAETQFYVDHLNALTLIDMMWKDDHFHLAAVPLAAKRRIAFVHGPVARMEWFCQWDLESVPVIAWRRLEAHMVRTCLLEERIFGVTKLATNCWSWMNQYKLSLFKNIQVPDIRGEFPAFQAEVSLSALRHANLMFGGFLLTAHNEFRFEHRPAAAAAGEMATAAGTTTTTRESGWMEATEALRYVLAEVGEGGDKGEELFVFMRKRVIEVDSEEYEEVARKQGDVLTPMLNAYADNIPTSPIPAGEKVDVEIMRELPEYCLYHTMPMTKEEHSSSLASRAQYSHFSVVMTDSDGGETIDFFLWFHISDCPEAIDLPQQIGRLHFVSPSTAVRLPAFEGDSSVVVDSFRYLIISLQ